ncbi:MAG TPA: alpha/beta hydrolase [Steroidobacteraceae bacterium]|nr:alpha/beta hydrolase [Steroidobacteraceae bacterium]
MPLDARAKRFLDTLAALNPPSALSLSASQRREALRHLLSFSGRTEVVGTVDDRQIPGPAGPMALRIYTPAAVPPGTALPGLVYFHGGGLVAGSLDTHDPICRGLTNAGQCRVLSVDYRLGPEARFPAAVDDGVLAIEWVRRHALALGLDPARIGVCGDSAGATLAAVVCQQARGTGSHPLALQFLLCPIMDFSVESNSRRELANGYLVDRETLTHDLEHYLPPGGDAADPRVSPLRCADLSGLPPTIIHTAEYDPLRDEGRTYAERLEAAGVRTLYRCHPGMIHLFYGMRALIPYAGTAFEQMGADIRGFLAAA